MEKNITVGIVPKIEFSSNEVVRSEIPLNTDATIAMEEQTEKIWKFRKDIQSGKILI